MKSCFEEELHRERCVALVVADQNNHKVSFGVSCQCVKLHLNSVLIYLYINKTDIKFVCHEVKKLNSAKQHYSIQGRQTKNYILHYIIL